MNSRFVLDTSVAMAWCFNDSDGGYAEAVLEQLRSHLAAVPSIWPLEVGNVLLVAERKNRIGEADSVRFLAMLKGLPIVVEHETPDRMLEEIVSLARRHNLSTYDASYLDLAMRLGLPLATDDVTLREAAQTCRVAMYDPRGHQAETSFS